jgi:hypothetical protein
MVVYWSWDGPKHLALKLAPSAMAPASRSGLSQIEDALRGSVPGIIGLFTLQAAKREGLRSAPVADIDRTPLLRAESIGAD